MAIAAGGAMGGPAGSFFLTGVVGTLSGVDFDPAGTKPVGVAGLWDLFDVVGALGMVFDVEVVGPPSTAEAEVAPSDPVLRPY